MTVSQWQQLLVPSRRVILPFVGDLSRNTPFPYGQWNILAPVFSWRYLQNRIPTAWIEIHGEDQWRSPKIWRKDYLSWLTTQVEQPVLMQESYASVPKSLRFPKELVQAVCPGSPFHGTMDWLLALVIALDVTDIALWGADYNTLHEEIYQKVGAAYWVGFASGRRIRVHIPDNSCILTNPMPRVQTYGYHYPPWPSGHHPHDFPDHYEQIIRL